MDGVEKYINKSKLNLLQIIKSLEENIEFLENDLWNDNNEFNSILEGIVNIYFDKYFLYKENNYDKISNYININKNINLKLKNILLAIIEYFEEKDNSEIIRSKESSILYLDILIYIGLKIYNSKFDDIDEPKKIEKEINNILDNFAKIRLRREKDLISLISSIKDKVEYNNSFDEKINKLNNIRSHNTFCRINKKENIYKVIYEYKIKELDDYEVRDKRIVEKKLNLKKEFNKISFDLCYYTMFKLLRNNKNKILLFPIKKDIFDKEFIEYCISNRNKNILKNINFFIKYTEMNGDYTFINLIREYDINIFIDMNEDVESHNYNMFMDIKNVICTEEFISKNEKYVEIWKDMKINFVIKDIESKISERNLLNRK